jgi:hypothetical protein
MTEILELLVTPALIVAAGSYLAKKFIEYQFHLKEKEYESSIKNSAYREIAVYKATMEQEALRFNVKTSGIYEKQALVFTQIYSRLSDLEFDMNIAIYQGTPWDKKYQKFKETYFELKVYWRRNRILLPSDIDRLISALVKDTFWRVENYGAGESRLMRGDFQGSDKHKNKAEDLNKSIPQIMEMLVDKFRDSIGVCDNNL